jgi:hypothetical protein
MSVTIPPLVQGLVTNDMRPLETPGAHSSSTDMCDGSSHTSRHDSCA